MPSKRLVSPDGRRTVLATGQAEIDLLEGRGYVVPSARRKKPEVANSGLEGQLRARASSTTEGQERLTGSTTLENAPEDPFGDEDDETEDDSAEETSDDDADKAAAARLAQQAATRRAAAKTKTTT